MTTVGAVLMMVGGIAFTAALVAGLYSVFGVWGGIAAAGLVIVAFGRSLVLLGGDE